MNKFYSILIFLLVQYNMSLYSQNVGINETGATPDNSSVLDLNTGNNYIGPNGKGLLIPNVSLTDTVDAITVSMPAVSLLVYNTNAVMTGAQGKGYYYNSRTVASPYWSKLITITDEKAGWLLTGNAGTTDGVNFIGTTDSVALSFRINNQKAGRIETDATYNTAFGYQALNVNTAATCTAIGTQVLRANTIGTGNTGIGNIALLSNTSGRNNTATGTEALRLNNTGIGNTANGFQSLRVNTNGIYNAAIGYQSLYNNNTGVSNTASGAFALVNNNTGKYNTANGSNALLANTTGMNNTALGYNADVSANNFTNATAIGAQALAGASNSIVLGAVNGINGATSNTKVGIGISTPQQALHVRGQVEIDTLLSGSITDGVVTVDTAGTLHKRPTSAFIGNSWNLTGNSGTTDGTNFLGTTDNVSLNFRINNQKAGRIDTVNAALGYQALNVNTGSNNVAIGTNTLKANTSGISNIAVGMNALYKNTTGSNLVAIGDSALHNQNGGVGLNTAIGSKALYSNTTGRKNTATGFKSLYSNTTGYENVASGDSALMKNTNGFHNVAIGSGALQNSTFAIGQTAVGYKAIGNTDAGGNVNTAIGDYSMFSLATGNYNTAVGGFSLYSNTGGNFNVGVGLQSLQFNTSGNSNTALGYIALQNMNGNDANTAIGSEALSDAGFNGKENTAVGYFAGLVNTTGNYNLLLGSNTNVPGSNSNYNSAIGSYAYISGSNITNATAIGARAYATNSNTLILGAINGTNGATADTKVGIGTLNPSQAKLVVNGSVSQTLSFAYFNGSASIGTATNYTGDYSIYASDRIAGAEFNAFSDQRIKKILSRSSSQQDLQTLNKIRITNYHYIDTIGKGNREMKKVIAQELEQVYPNAVSKLTDVVPDIYQVAEITNGKIFLKTDLKKGEHVKLVFEKRTEMAEVTNAGPDFFEVDIEENGKVFVYGREVNDFRTVDYEALTTLNISATQELYKKIQQVELENEVLKSELAKKADVTEIEELKQAITELKKMLTQQAHL